MFQVSIQPFVEPLSSAITAVALLCYDHQLCTSLQCDVKSELF